MSPGLADGLEDLTADWFTQALREGGVVSESSSVTDARAEHFGTGQFGQVARASLTYDGDAGDAPESVIVKLPSLDEGSKQLGIAIGAYEAEVRFYQDIAPRANVVVPTLYWGGFEPGTGRVTLVLEDLSDEWEVGDSVAGGTIEQAEAAFDQTARLQSSLWDVPELRELDWLASPARTQLLFDGVSAALPLFRERFGPLLDPLHMELVEALCPRGNEYPDKAWVGPMVVSHGDFRLDNVMFSKAQPMTANVIDWQSVRLGPPLMDIAIFMGSCLAPGLRRAHQDALVKRYHDGLVAGGVADYSLDDCVASLRVCSLYTFLLGVSISVTLERTERGDAMFAALVSQSAELVVDTGAGDFLD